MTKEDLKLVSDCLKEQKIDILNTRAFKLQDGKYLITIGSIQKQEKTVSFQGKEILLQWGEFSEYLKDMVE